MGECDPADVPGSLRQFLAAPPKLAAHGVDAGRVGTFAVSANVGTSFPLIMDPAASPGVRAAVFYYGNGDAPAFRTDLPVLHVLAGLDGAGLLAGQRRMWDKAREAKAPWTMVDAPTLPHAFDAVVTTPESLAAIAQTFAFWDSNLKPLPAVPAESEAARDARLGIAASYGQEWARAVAIYERIVERDPADGGALAALAWAQQGDGRLAEAEASLVRALALDPRNRFASRRLGIVQAKRDRCGEAAKTLAPVLAAGNDFGAANELGLCAMRTDDPGAAVGWFETATRISSQPFAAYNLACALARSGRKDRALATLEPLAAQKFGTRSAWSADTDLASLLGDPRFEALLARLDP
jgi:tetratricopeptide (TPR) repeat protein